ncbi:MAG: ATP-binding cassette domain-containing protein [Actinomycetota bacterium]|nr:ATP-binding cassette domain-containing protein [Actinomycetota bacterium]
MGYVDVANVSFVLADGRVLFSDVSLRVGEGAKVALVGANGTGKTTLLRLVAGDLGPTTGNIARVGGLGVMRQFIGSIRDASTVRDLLLSLAPPRVRAAGEALDRAELALIGSADERVQLRYADALATWGDAGGYQAEVLFDTVTVAALGLPYDRAAARPVATLSGGEQKRLALEALLRGPDDVLLLDEPDNYLDVPGKRWLEDRLRESAKTVLFVSHDRELLARTATRVVTLEGGTAWTHGGSFATYSAARTERHEHLDELRRRWDEEQAKLKALVLMYRQKAAYNSDMASRLQAAVTRLRKFEEAGPPEERPREQNVVMRLRGGRTGKRAVVCRDLELTGLMRPFDVEVFYGERVAVLGSNGSGKSHFLRLLARGGSEGAGAVDGLPIAPVAHTGLAKLGARVLPGLFAQTHEHPELLDRTLVDVLWRGDDRRSGMDRNGAMRALRRYELDGQGDQSFGTLSGGQQARFQILLLELAGATLLLLDEPTDNLDLASAEALQEGLEAYEGTVLAVTHDRWFGRAFDRFLIFGADGAVYESAEPVWDEGRVARAAR